MMMRGSVTWAVATLTLVLAVLAIGAAAQSSEVPIFADIGFLGLGAGRRVRCPDPHAATRPALRVRHDRPIVLANDVVGRGVREATSPF